ncbi:MAG: DNA replication/repair protein RecF [Bulleidia sp.]
MYVRKLELRNFRNYSDLSIELTDRMNIITGHNAQGKTNLLESLVFLSSTRSHRIHDDRKMIRNGCEFAIARCEYDNEGRTGTLQGIIHNKGKTLMKDGYPVMKSSEFIGTLNTVLFSPDDLRIFDDSPRERRKLINQVITGVSRSYLNELTKYQSVLKQRNILLKNDRPDGSLLDIMDRQMAHCESVIHQEREEFVRFMNQWMTRIYARLSDDAEEVTIRYVSHYDTSDENQIEEKRKGFRKKDIEFRVTTIGIHKDDVIFEKNGNNIIETASQGQKRMVILAFRLSLLIYIRNRTGTRPVLLLDDVLSELDHDRQIRLLNMVGDKYQCVITTTELPPYLRNLKYREFHIENGMLKNIKEA